MRETWYRHVLLGVGPPEWTCTVRGSNVPDVPRSVRCARVQQFATWTLAR